MPTDSTVPGAAVIRVLADTIDATEAHRLGLVNFIVPAAELETKTAALAARLAAGPTQAYGRIKTLLRESLSRDLPAQLDAEREAFHAGLSTADFREGVAAFLAKRMPHFTGA